MNELIEYLKEMALTLGAFKVGISVCSSGYVDPVEKVNVTLGGKEFSYGKRRSNSHCFLVCGDYRSERLRKVVNLVSGAF